MGLFRVGGLRRGVAIATSVAVVATLAGVVGLRGLTGANAYSSDPGSPDPSWGTNGEIIYDAVGGQEAVVGAQVDTHRRLTVVSQRSATSLLVISRRGASGSADEAFGNHGYVVIDVPSLSNYPSSSFVAKAMTINSNGRILIGGILTDFSDTHWALAELDSVGNLTTIGSGQTGVETGDFDSTQNGVNAVAVDSQNRILLAGYATVSGSRQPRVARLTPEAILDTSFGAGVGYIGPAGVFGGEDWMYTDVIAQPAIPSDNVERVVAVGTIEHIAGTPARTIVNRFEDAGQDVTFTPDHAGGLFAVQPIPPGALAGATSVDNVADGGLVVGLAAPTYADGGGVLRLDRVGTLVPSFGTSGFANTTATSDLAVYGEHIFITGYAGGVGTDHGLIGSISDVDGVLESTFAPDNVPHINTFPLEGTPNQDQSPILALDRAGTPIVAFDNDDDTIADRFVAFTPPSPSPGSKILFSDETVAGHALFGMTPDGSDLVPLVPALALDELNPQALQGSSLVWEHHDASGSTLYQADASGGTNVQDFVSQFNALNPYGQTLPAGNITSPSLSEDFSGQYVTALIGGCVTLIDLGYRFFNDKNRPSNMCGYDSVSARQGNPSQWIATKHISGAGVDSIDELWFGDLGNGALAPPHRIATSLDHVRGAKWGLDGELIVIEAMASGYNVLVSVGGGPRDDVYDNGNLITPEGPNPSEAFKNIYNTAHADDVISSFVPALDGADPSVIFTWGSVVEKVGLDQSGLEVLFRGVAPLVSGWTRNLAAFPLNGSRVTLEPTSIPTSAVPLQVRNPNAPPPLPAQLQDSALLKLSLLNSGLLKINLIDAKLLKINLIDAPLLKINLIDAKLLKINLIDAPIGLAPMGLPGDLGASPKVRAGLDAISLYSLTIVDGPSWRDRIAALHTPEADALNKATLAQISLGDVLRLSPQPSLPDLSQLDLSQSVFGRLASMPFLLGDTRLTDVAPLTTNAAGQTYGIDWCGIFAALQSPECGAEYGVPGSADRGMSASLLSLQISGLDLDHLPTTTLPGGHSHVNDLRTISYDQVRLDPAKSLLPNVILSSIGGTAHPSLANTSVGEALVTDITPDRNAVVDCSDPDSFDCDANPPATLLDAQDADALWDDAVLGQLGHALDGYPLNALILGVVGSSGEDPYDAPAAELGITPQTANSAGTKFGVWFSRVAMGDGYTTSPTLTARLPVGFEYKDASSTVRIGDEQAQPIEPVVNVTTDGDGTQHTDLTWEPTLALTSGIDVLKIEFTGLAVKPHDAVEGEAADRSRVIASISDGTFAQQVGSDTVVFTDGLERGDSPTSPNNVHIHADTLYFARLDARPKGAAPDVDYYYIDAPPAGSTLTVYLSQLRYNADLAVFHPEDARGPNDPLRPPTNAPVITPLGDVAPNPTNVGEPLVTDGEADIPLPAGHPVAGISNNQGTKAERVKVITWPTRTEGRPYLVQVSGMNGASGPDPYALRYSMELPPHAPSGTPRSYPTQVHPPGPTLPGSPIESVILTNPSRLTDLYGPVAAGQVAVKLDALAAATHGVVVPVDAYDDVVQAYANADENPADPDKHNDVVRAINTAVDSLLGARRSEVHNITVVGTDEILPMARVPDLTQIANERSFAQDILSTGVDTGGNNALLGSARAGRILSDDPYASFNPRAFGGGYIYAPDVAIGRLVETPAQIEVAIDQYLTPVDGTIGTLYPSKTLSAGYDFMTMMSNLVKDAFAAQLPGSMGTSLISDAWKKSDILGLLGSAAEPAPDLISVNAHYSPTFFAPADRSQGNVSSEELGNQSDLSRRLFFTIGCHSGYNITDYLAGGDLHDFAQVLAGEPVSAFVGNTGFGLGLAVGHAFSQKLFTDFATRLANGSLGAALQQAKQEYLADGVTNPYDYKVMAEAVYFGIPQYTILGATPLPTPPSPPPPTMDGQSGLQAASLTSSQPTQGPGSDVWQRTDSGDGSFWTLPGAAHAIAQNRPIQPKVQQELTQPDLTAAGVMVTALKIGDDEQNFDPVLARPVVDNAGREPELQFGDVLFPAKLAEVADYGQGRQRLQVVPAQFRSTGFGSDGQLVGVERRFSEVGTQTFYRSSAEANPDLTPPTLSGALAEQSGGTTTFSVVVADGESSVVRVTALYRRGANSEFELADLAPDPTLPGLWRTTLPIGDALDFMMQAVNSDALVGAISNRGQLFDEVQVPVDPGVETVAVTTSHPPVSGGLYDSPLDVTFTSNRDTSTMVLNVDGGPDVQSPGGVASAHLDEGIHTVSYRTVPLDPDALPVTGAFTATVDVSDPTVTVTSPDDSVPAYAVGEAVAAEFSCDDLTLISCSGTDHGASIQSGDPLDTATATAGNSTRSVRVKGIDAVGRSTTVAHDYRVLAGVEHVEITFDRPFDAAPDFYTGPVTVHVASSDATSTITFAVDDGAPVSYAGNDVTFTTDRDHTLVYLTSRGATNSGDPVHVKVDANPPEIQITTPAEGGRYYLHENKTIGFACIDPFLVSCIGSRANGSPLDTGDVTDGVTPHPFTVVGTDQLGRSASGAAGYHVSYEPGSFACADGPGHQTIGKVFANKPTPTRGQEMHIIFRVCDAFGTSVAEPAPAPALGLPREVDANGNLGAPALGSCNPLLDLLPICTPLSKRATKFKPLDGARWTFSQDTSQLSQGLHRFRVSLRDGTSFDYVLNRQPL